MDARAILFGRHLCFVDRGPEHRRTMRTMVSRDSHPKTRNADAYPLDFKLEPATARNALACTQVRKPGQYRSFQRLEMGDRISEFVEATFRVGNLHAEQVLIVGVARIALQVFVSSISQGHSGTRQRILQPLAENGLFVFRPPK